MSSDFNAQRRAQLLIERVADYAIYMLNPDGTVASWNAGARRFKGYTEQEILGQHFSRFYTDEDRAAGVPAYALKTALESGRFEAEGWRVRKDGTRFWASVVIDAIHDDSGQLFGFAKITRDITDKKLAREALRRTEEQFRLLVDSVVDYAIYMLSPEGVVTTWNAGARKIKGYTAEEIVGSHFSRFYTDEDRRAGLPERILEQVRQQGRFEAEGLRVRKDGSTFRANVVIDAIHDADGKLVGFAKITRDVTQRTQLEDAREALQHSQRLEAVGKLTGGVAHDFNNILQVIGGSLQLLSGTVAGIPAAQRHLGMAMSAVDRGGKLAAQLLAFARRQPLQPVVLNAGRVVRGLEDLVQRAVGETIEVETAVSASLWNTLIDPHQLENVVLNLAINARDAMPHGGKLTIELSNTMLDDSYVSAAHGVPPGQYVLLAISDTGTGMAPEVLARAVEPFFTTKGEGQGTGLGLSMAFGFVKQSGGHFRIYSEVGDGTTIKAYFPRSLEAEQALPEQATGDVRGGTETILVVEDDLNVQATVVGMLSELGYQVLRADNAEMALAVLRAGVRCDLLFTDVVMPGKIKSPEMARQARALLPNLKVLYTSGYTQNAIIHGGRLDPGVELLSKPYRREKLAAKVRQMLGGQEQPAAAPAAKAAREIRPDGLRVLLIEDDAQARELYRDILEAAGYRVAEAPTAAAAMEILGRERFDAAVVDYSLPDQDGLSLARRIVAAHPGVALVFASGYGSLVAGASDMAARVLTKPFTDMQLKHALLAAVDEHTRRGKRA
ncbi:Blue-light-activated protein [Massilia sp. Bi118]|uniref:PAS domain S-box protein n=1 Tax=Massilia sp. Bi118 TaxID=2822346 RepID=UPI001E0FCB8A|nr:PAS domain S-box protein [Massilia sp. Bi118]CAH0307357.1 Blue-light-activated protein [Massilia sp. Bi118]